MASGSTAAVNDWQDVSDWQDVDSGGSHPLDAIGHGISEWWKQVSPAGMVEAVQHPGQALHNLGNQNAALWQRAKDAYDKGDYPAAIAHGINYAVNGIPGLGYSLDEAGNKFSTGDVAGGLGQTAGIATNLIGPKVAPKITGAIGAGLQKAAVPVMESGLGIRAMDRAYGATPGAAVLANTTGLTPDAVSQSARGRIGNVYQALENDAAASPQKASLAPARQLLDEKIATAQSGNSMSTPPELGVMRKQLTTPKRGFAGATEFPPGSNTPINVVDSYDPATMEHNGMVVQRGETPPMTISELQNPAVVARMKREFGNDFTKWNPLHPERDMATARAVRHELDKEVDRTVPRAQEKNQEIQSLINAAERAEQQNLNAGITQKVLHRAAAHTGALVGAAAGYHAAGIPGGIAGLVAPELISSPTARIAAARGIYKGGKAAGSNLAKQATQAAAAANIARPDPLDLNDYIDQ